MRKQVILTVVEGSFELGFPVVLRIWKYGAVHETQFWGKLPPAPNILQIVNNFRSVYNQWQSIYRIRPIKGQVTNFSCRDVASSGSQLAECLNEWLNSDYQEWKKIREELLWNLSEDDEIEFIIQTRDMRLRQLPWHLWDLISERYQNAEFILSGLNYQPPPPPNRTNKVRILAILGDTTNINVELDKAILQEQLPDAEIDFLVQPNRRLLYEQLWEQQWDILFFAGHSASQADGSKGEIYINQDDSLPLEDIKNALKRAVDGGDLQLAIFNSCDGLGLAQTLLADLNIPIIVMRMPVPDVVAQEFLRYFLRAFASGKPLHLAVREAREGLQGLENEFPCASWLAALCQNPTKKQPVTWQGMKNGTTTQQPLTGQENPNEPPTPPSVGTLRWRLLRKVLLGVLTTTALPIILQLLSQLPLIYSIFPFNETLPFEHGDIISLECQSKEFRLKLSGNTEKGVKLKNFNKDDTETEWEVDVRDDKTVRLKIPTHSQWLDAYTGSGTLGLAKTVDTKTHSGTGWKVYNSNSRKKIIQLENKGTKRENSGLKWLSCKNGEGRLVTDAGKNYRSSQWKFNVVRSATK